VKAEVGRGFVVPDAAERLVPKVLGLDQWRAIAALRAVAAKNVGAGWKLVRAVVLAILQP